MTNRPDRREAALRAQQIELPSWAFGNSGTRFKVFGQPGVPRDAAREDRGRRPGAPVHRRRAERRAAHPVGPGRRLRRAGRARRRPRGRGSAPINSNMFQDDDYRLGSVANPDPRVRRKALDHLLECVDIMDATGSRDLKLWFADGTNYPGQDDIRGPPGPAGRLAGARSTHGSAPASAWCWSTSCSSRRSTRPTCPTGAPSLLHCLALGPKAQVVRRHRPPRAWHQHRVHRRAAAAGRAARRVRLQLPVLRRRRPDGRARPTRSSCSGSCTRSSRPARSARRRASTFMLDQCHNIEPKIPAQIRSVMNVQEATAKALLVDADALAAAQQAGDVLGAPTRVLMDAYNTDVRPLLAELRAEQGLDPDPMAAYRRSGYAEKIVAERIGGTQAGWGAERDGLPSANEALSRGGALSRATAESTELLAPRSNRLGADPRNTNYAGGNTSAKGTATDPVTGEPVELLWVKGSGGDLGTLTAAGPGRAAARPAAGAGRRLPGRRARGRDGRRVRLLPARQGRRGPVDRHRDARPGRRRARGPPAPRRRDRARDRGRRRGADQGRASATGSCGCRGGGPGFQLGLDIAAVAPGQPAGDRRDPRRARHHRLGRDQRRVRGQLAGDHPRPRRRFLDDRGDGRAVRRRRAGLRPLPEARAAGPGPPRSRR